MSKRLLSYELREYEEMINRKQFGRKFSERYGITYHDADWICKGTFELLGDLLYKEKEDVVINGFGSFKHKTIKGKKINHPKTGEIITVSDRDVVRFTPSELLNTKEY